jgi:hypothetical protein
MNKTRKGAFILVCIAICSSLSVGVAIAGTATSVSSFHAGINEDDYSGVVPLGVTVYIYWGGVSPPDTGTVDVKVIDPDGGKILEWPNLLPSESGTKSFAASEVGEYLVILEGNPSYSAFTRIVASGSVTVVPESVLGALMAIGAGFAAFGAVGIVKKTRNKA